LQVRDVDVGRRRRVHDQGQGYQKVEKYEIISDAESGRRRGTRLPKH
jgi:hypothetical protein